MASRNTNQTDLTNNGARRTGSTLFVMQTIEYVRAFLISGVGLVRYNINVLLFTSEVFGIFKKNRVLEVGGYKRDDQVAHMELVMRLQKHMKQIRERGRIIYSRSDLQGRSTRYMASAVQTAYRLAHAACKQFMDSAEHDLQSGLWLDGDGIHPVFYFDRIVGACVGTGSDRAVHCRHRATVGGY